MPEDYSAPAHLPDDDAEAVAREAESAALYYKTLTRAFIDRADALQMTLAWIQARSLPRIELPPDSPEEKEDWQ
jgi:hypothetical protein